MIVVEPSSGLCSRIYVLCDAYSLAKQYHKKLIILWQKTADCNCDYYDVFDKSQFSDIPCKVLQFQQYGYEIKGAHTGSRLIHYLRICMELIRRTLYTITYTSCRLFYRTQCSFYKNTYQDGNKPLEPSVASTHNCFIEAYNTITDENDISTIRFSRKALKLSDSIISKYHGRCVGIHIRRTDHGPATAHSTTEHFIDHIEQILSKHPDYCFYLATDDWNEQERLLKRFGNKMITFSDKTLNRSSKAGMYSSVIDFLCLSQTNYILGSYSSVFSKFSAQLGNIDLIII